MCVLEILIHCNGEAVQPGDTLVASWSYNRSNNSVFLYLKIYWNPQDFDLILASEIWMKLETLRHQATSSKF